VGLPWASSAQDNDSNCSFDQLFAESLALRASDAGVGRITERESLATRIEDCVDMLPQDPRVAVALLNATAVWSDLFRKHGNSGHAVKALLLSKRIEQTYPGETVAAEAGLQRAAVFRQLGDTDIADRILSGIEARFKHTVFARKAALARSELQRNSGVQPSRVFGDPDEAPYLVVVDPGHGGDDQGARGPHGLEEKAVVLSIAQEMVKEAEGIGDFTIRLTRSEDEKLPLSERTKRANEWGASLFVSLHTNASSTHRAHGLSTYYLDNTGDQAARSLAERENAAPASGGVESGDISVMLSSLIQSAKLEESVVLAHDLEKGVMDQTRGRGYPLKTLGVKRAPFFVLVGAHMPCALLEVLFVDNQDDAKLLNNADFRREVARGILRGIRAYRSRSAREN
jgi:N-acetylmuramoyl-L-alanine amidase